MLRLLLFENFFSYRLRYINETSIIHVLRHRFGSNLLYTFAGSQKIICMTGDYQPYICDKLVELFKGCRRQQMPPHIYAFAQQIYRFFLFLFFLSSCVFNKRYVFIKVTLFEELF